MGQKHRLRNLLRSTTCLWNQVVEHALPVGVLFTAEMDVVVAELVCTVFRAVIDEIGARLETQVFVVREDDTLVKDISEILPHPIVFVLQGRGIVPWGCGEDIAVVFVFQHIHSIYGSRHWLHQCKQTGDVLVEGLAIAVICILGFHFFTHLIESALKVDQYVVHVKIKYRFHFINLLVYDDKIVTSLEKFKKE